MAFRKIIEYDDDITLKLQEQYTNIIAILGENIQREGLIKTPERVAKSMQFLTHGYQLNPIEILQSALFNVDINEMVIIKDIELYSMCEHHLLPFFGKVHIGYLPKGKIVGLSKIPRIVDVFARRLQVQEKLTQEILYCIDDVLQPFGVAIVIEAQHLCMMMRGVSKQNSITITSAFTGDFQKQETRNEFISLIKQKSNY